MTEAIAATARWQSCAIVEVVTRTPAIKSFFLRLSETFDYTAGQHVDVRLTAPNGYTAIRSYSIASAPSDSKVIELAIERLVDGEVSPFFHDVAQVGDTIELRGPLGGHFLWPGPSNKSVLLIGAGSGVVPLMAMARHRARAGAGVPARLLFSSRSPDEIIYADELDRLASAGDGFEVVHALTRRQPPGWTGYARRIDEPMLAEVLEPLGAATRAFACGPTSLVETVANGLVRLGLPPDRIRTERFGPTGT